MLMPITGTFLVRVLSEKIAFEPVRNLQENVKLSF